MLVLTQHADNSMLSLVTIQVPDSLPPTAARIVRTIEGGEESYIGTFCEGTMMRKIQHLVGQLLLLTLSLVGVGIALYLTAVHYENAPLLCSTRGLIDCSRVLSSPYSVVPGTTIPISVPGMAWSVVSAALAIVGLRLLQPQVRRRIQLAEFVWSLLGMLTVLYLVYVELVLLHTICAWCTALHIIILVMFLSTIVQLQQTEDEPEEAESAKPTPIADKVGRDRYSGKRV